MTNCQQNKHGLGRQETSHPPFLVTRFLFGVKLSGQLTRVSKLKIGGHTCGAVNHGKLEFTMVNILQCDLDHSRRSYDFFDLLFFSNEDRAPVSSSQRVTPRNVS